MDNSLTTKRMPVKGFTIDGLFSRDLDDALWARKNPKDGSLFVDVSIADVASMIPKDSELDQAAYKKGFTRYFETSNDPMFPRELSEDKSSLWPHKPRNTITLTFPVTKNAEVLPPKISKTVLTSVHKLSYEQVDYIIADGYGIRQDQLKVLNALATKLLNGRRAKGGLAIYDIMSGWATNEEGRLYKIDEESNHLANIIVQEMMILANISIANFLIEKNTPALFRNHTASAHAPSQESMVADFNTMLKAGDKDRLETVQKRWGMVLNRATYGQKLEGHYGLNLPAYLHFTSPIRRYADLVNHRIVSALLEGQQSPYTSEELETIATHLNVVQKSIKDRSRHSYMNQARIRLIEEVGQNKLALLSTSDFSKVLRSACNENKFTPELEEAIISRLNANQLMVRDVYYILMEALPKTDWQNLRNLCMTWLVSHRVNAITILSLAEQNGRCGRVIFNYKPGGAPHQSTFSCIGLVKASDQQFKTEPIQGNAKKSVRDQAALALVSALADVELSRKPNTEADNVTTATSVVQKIKLPKNDQLAENFKGQLMEKCQQQRWPQPEFLIRASGQDHDKVFMAMARLTIGTTLYVSEEVHANTKKIAEQLASQSLMSKLPSVVAIPNPEPTLVGTGSANYVGMLHEACIKLNLPMPSYREEKVGPDHTATYIVYCTVNGTDPVIETSGHKSTKKLAKHTASEIAYYQLRDRQ